MPESLKKSEIKREADPSVAKQFENVDFETKFKDFYEIADSLKIAMMGTYRPGIGPVARAMAVSKRSGPDFLFLSNAHSQKFIDIESHKEISIVFQDSSKQHWISISGEVVTSSNDDPRIKEIYSKPVAAWFGDLKDGVHTGGPEDPRMTLIEVQPKYISYYKHTTGTLGMMKEVGVATLTGGVAQTGSLREIQADEIARARSKDSALSTT